MGVENLFFVERSILRDSEFCRVGGAIDAFKEAQELFAAVLTLAPKSTGRFTVELPEPCDAWSFPVSAMPLPLIV